MRRFLRREEGAGTVFSLAMLMMAALLGGLAVDVGNAWRYNEVLQSTADVAAHAGAVVLAQGGSGAEAEAIALAAIERNMPEARWGRVLDQPARDVRAVHFDALAGGILPDGGAPNAVLVRVARSAATGNPVRTVLMRLAGRDAWDVTAESLAALVPTQRCQGSDGIYGRGLVMPGPGVILGRGVCLHSQEKVVPDQGSRFEEGASLSMPDLARCGMNCTDQVSDGASAAASEVNLIRPDLGGMVAQLADEFSDPRNRGGAEAAFFGARRLGADLTPLDEVGVKIDDLGTGSVVDLSPLAFNRLRFVPEGLTYRVRCTAAPGAPPVLQVPGMDGILPLTDGRMATDASDPEGTANEQPPQILRNFVLVTDCQLAIQAGARLDGVALISTRTAKGPAVLAEAGSTIGSLENACGPGRRASILALGSMVIPAGVLGTNVGLVTAGDLRIAVPPQGGAAVFGLRGVGLHAGGTVALDVSHALEPCGGETDGDPFTPPLQVIRQVAPRMAEPPASS